MLTKWRLAALAMCISQAAGAMMMEPTFHAANALGFYVVGEIEFAPRHHTSGKQILKNQFDEVRAVCGDGSRNIRLVLLAWSDLEYPPSTVKDQGFNQRLLADQRAAFVAQYLRKKIRQPVQVDLVNMSTRQPYTLRLPEAAPIEKESFDIKTAFEIAGAAPSDSLGVGLFGEYGQSGKVVVLLECPTSGTSRSMNSGQFPESKVAFWNSHAAPLS
jgi:hypothetical protein